MNKSNIKGKNDRRDVNSEWFTGKTWMKVLSEKIKSKDQDIYHVHFEKGSRTKLHFHNGNQVLMAVKGKGSLEIFKKYGTKKSDFKIKKTERISLNEGDIVHIPAKTLHTHGSIDKNKEFSHIAINILPKKNSIYKTIWYESDFKNKVTKNNLKQCPSKRIQKLVSLMVVKM
ncbi:cupin [Nitrosopumilus sp.]|nr:cupin [Nitrosopumilus sp.]